MLSAAVNPGMGRCCHRQYDDDDLILFATNAGVGRSLQYVFDEICMLLYWPVLVRLLSYYHWHSFIFVPSFCMMDSPLYVLAVHNVLRKNFPLFALAG